MVAGEKMNGFDAAMGIKGHQSKDISIIELGCNLGPNVLWPGESAEFSFRVNNASAAAINGPATVHVIHYGTRGQPGDVWNPQVFKIDDAGVVDVQLKIPAKGSADFTFAPPIGKQYGGYALVLELPDRGNTFMGTCVRVPKAQGGREWLPTYALDLSNASPQLLQLFKKLGVKAARMEFGYVPTDAKDFDARMQRLAGPLKWAMDNDVSVMLTLGAGSATMPLGRGRPFLNDDNSMKDRVKEDLAWLPEHDADFQKWVKYVAGKYGYPHGPVNAVELWNEPWEGVSISGWGADMLRYREIYTHMAQGVVEARQADGVKVLIGGACSSSNTRDKLFPDSTGGKYDGPFLKWLDFVSIHYQPLAADPALVPEWLNRQGEYGPVRVWDTESWVANSEDRVAAVIASMRAQGQSRTAGIFFGNVYTSINRRIDKQEIAVVQAWPPAAGIAAVQQFIGQRPFTKLLFSNGLPWVFVFDGLPREATESKDALTAANPDDGTLVIVGDLGGCYERERTRFRQLHGLANREKIKAARGAGVGHDIQGNLASTDGSERRRGS